jgi:hypothetical protein
MRWGASAVASLAAALAGDAWCCSIAGPPLVIDPAEQAVDVTPPGQVAIVAPQLKRGVGPSSGCGGQTATSCNDLGRLTLHVVAPAVPAPNGTIALTLLKSPQPTDEIGCSRAVP